MTAHAIGQKTFLSDKIGAFFSFSKRKEDSSIQMSSSTSFQVDALRKNIMDFALHKRSPAKFTIAGTSVASSSARYSAFFRNFASACMSSPSLTVAMAPMGMTTAFNVITGAVAASNAYQRLNESSAVGDKRGERQASLDVARGTVQSLTGAAFTAARPLSIVYNLQNDLDAVDRSSMMTTHLGRAAFLTQTIGNTLFALFYLLFACVSGVSLSNISHFKSKLYGGKSHSEFNTPEGVKHLIQSLSEKHLKTTGASTLQKHLNINKKYAEPLAMVKNELHKKAVLPAAKWLQKSLAELDPQNKEKLSLQECEDLALQMFEIFESDESKHKMLSALGFDEKTDEELFSMAQSLTFPELIGLDITNAERQRKKELKMAGPVSPKFVRELKKALNDELLQRLDSSDEVIKKAALGEAQQLIEKMNQNLKFNTSINAGRILGCTIGAVATIMGIIFTGGIAAIAISSVLVLTAVILTFVDMGLIVRGLASDVAQGKYDKWLVTLSTILCAASLATSLVLISVFSLGTAPLAFAVVIGVLWLCSCIFSAVQLYRKNRAFNQEHPTLESLSKKVARKNKTDPIDEPTRALFKKLSSSEKKQIKRMLAQKAGIENLDLRELSENDRLLDIHNKFGEVLLEASPMDADVLEAVAKVCKEKKIGAVRGLWERMKLLNKMQNEGSYSQCQLREIQSFFKEKLTEEEKTAVAARIYRRRAKGNASRYFKYKVITNEALASTLQELLVAKKTEMIKL